MALKMGNSATASVEKMSSSLVLDAGASSGIDPQTMLRIEAIIEAEVPEELRASAKGLLRAVATKVAVPGHYDAFCCQAFSKPEWAAASSVLIAEMFEQDEDQLAELARIPDLVIEMGSGQVNVTCMVASRWAARGETHRLSRLADAIVASHASKNACAVDVMLALAATLAVTRFSRAEQLYNAALPLAGEEHQEVMADAKRWLAAGRVVCSAAQEERDFWDVRLRKPKVVWTWRSKAEREALDHLSECLAKDAEGAELYKAVLPECWWELAMKYLQQQEKLVLATQKQEAVKLESGVSPKAQPEPFPSAGRVSRETLPHPHAGPLARFLLPWFCGCLAMLLTVLLLPREFVVRILDTLKPKEALSTPAEMEAWRKEALQKKSVEMAQYAPQQALAKTGDWHENEQVISGQSKELPFESPQYLQLLVWLHLDPPQNEEVRMQVCTQLLKRVKADAISLWELLVYPGSTNAVEIKKAARDALTDKSFQWSEEEKKRLGMIGADKKGYQSLPTTGKKK
jgi:PIN domain nuclease of toxin-antitoxin system